MRVRDVMSTEVITITPDTTYEEAVKLLIHHRYSGFPVVSKDGLIVGMLSEKNLFRGLYPRYEDFMSDPAAYIRRQEDQESIIHDLRKQPIEKFMYREVVTIGPDAPIMRAGGIMLARNFYRLPVVEGGKIIGMVTREHVFSNILKSQLGISDPTGD